MNGCFHISVDVLEREHNCFEVVLAGFGRCSPARTDTGVDGLVDLDVGFGDIVLHPSNVVCTSEVVIGDRTEIGGISHFGVDILEALSSFLDISSACSFRSGA